MHISPLGSNVLGLYSTPEDGFTREDSRLTQVANKLLRRFGADAESFLTSDMQHKSRQLVMQIRNVSWHDVAYEVRRCGIYVTHDAPLAQQPEMSRGESAMNLNDQILGYCDRSGFGIADIDANNLRHMVTIANLTPRLISDEIIEEELSVNDGIPPKGQVVISSNEWWSMQSDAWKEHYPELCTDEDRYLITDVTGIKITGHDKITVTRRKILVSFPSQPQP